MLPSCYPSNFGLGIGTFINVKIILLHNVQLSDFWFHYKTKEKIFRKKMYFPFFLRKIKLGMSSWVDSTQIYSNKGTCQNISTFKKSQCFCSTKFFLKKFIKIIKDWWKYLQWKDWTQTLANATVDRKDGNPLVSWVSCHRKWRAAPMSGPAESVSRQRIHQHKDPSVVLAHVPVLLPPGTIRCCSLLGEFPTNKTQNWTLPWTPVYRCYPWKFHIFQW